MKAVSDRWGAAPSHGYRRPSGPNADGAATVRNILPWRNMQKELAKRLAAKAAKGELSGEIVKDGSSVPPWKAKAAAGEIEPAPDSGVRSSVVPFPAAGSDDPMRPLTYSVYTVSELDVARAPQRLSPVPEPKPSGFRDVARSARVLLGALASWIRAPKPRPRLLDLVRVPAAALGADLRVALGRLPWKRIAWTALIGVGAVLVFLFAVVTVAELTDDVKPGRSTNAAKYRLDTTSADAPAGGSSSASEPASAEPIELDDEPVAAPAPAPPPAKTTKPAAKHTKPKASKKPKPADMFVP